MLLLSVAVLFSLVLKAYFVSHLFFVSNRVGNVFFFVVYEIYNFGK